MKNNLSGNYGIKKWRNKKRDRFETGLFQREDGKSTVCHATRIRTPCGLPDSTTTVSPSCNLPSIIRVESGSLDDAYKVLEIEPTATDEEVRAAYRRMAVKHHPDKVASLGEDIRKAANEKFQKINEAKERIYQSRGLK